MKIEKMVVEESWDVYFMGYERGWLENGTRLF